MLLIYFRLGATGRRARNGHVYGELSERAKENGGRIYGRSFTLDNGGDSLIIFLIPPIIYIKAIERSNSRGYDE